MNYEHHKVDSPYRMRFAIYVRKGEETYDKVDEVPEQLRKRTLAARAFDEDGMMVDFELVEGDEAGRARSSACSPSRAPPICTSISRRPAAMRRAWNGPRDIRAIARHYIEGDDEDADSATPSPPRWPASAAPARRRESSTGRSPRATAGA